MKRRIWPSLVALALVLGVLPFRCHADDEFVAPVSSMTCQVSAPAENSSDHDCTCYEDCFCCTLVIPMPFSEFSSALACESVWTQPHAQPPLDRSSSIYHPPRGWILPRTQRLSLVT